MLGDKDMKEAEMLGFLEMEGKGEVVSFRLSWKAVAAINKLAAQEDIKRSNWLEEAVIEKLVKLKRQHDCLSDVFSTSTNTTNTTNTDKEKA